MLMASIADTTGNPLIQLITTETLSTAQLESWDLATRGKRVDRALTSLEVGCNLINREYLIRMVPHLTNFSPLLLALFGKHSLSQDGKLE